MSYKVKQIALILILAASLVGSAALHAESIMPALHATMRTMRASLAQIGDFSKGTGEPAAALDAATKVVTLAKSIPSTFPPGSELTELPSKNGAPPPLGTTSTAFSTLRSISSWKPASFWPQSRTAQGVDWPTVEEYPHKACSACHDQFREE